MQSDAALLCAVDFLQGHLGLAPDRCAFQHDAHLEDAVQVVIVLCKRDGCRGIWGPHLIVVPTSVMLNWEMECKRDVEYNFLGAGASGAPT